MKAEQSECTNRDHQAPRKENNTNRTVI